MDQVVFFFGTIEPYMVCGTGRGGKEAAISLSLAFRFVLVDFGYLSHSVSIFQITQEGKTLQRRRERAHQKRRERPPRRIAGERHPKFKSMVRAQELRGYVWRGVASWHGYFGPGTPPDGEKR